jgi:hypothetical protein
MNWPGFGQFWTQAMRDTIRRENTSSLVPSSRDQHRKGTRDGRSADP